MPKEFSFIVLGILIGGTVVKKWLELFPPGRKPPKPEQRAQVNYYLIWVGVHSEPLIIIVTK